MGKDSVGEGNVIEALSPIDYKISGNGNVVRIGKNCKIKGLISIVGDNNSVIVGDWCTFHESFIGVQRASGCRIGIGSGTTISSKSALHAHEQANISIGNDCMISSGVFVTVSDMHPVYQDSIGERINFAQSIVLGDHVWLGYECYVGRGSVIGEGAVVEAKSVVAGVIPPFCLATGNPARPVRHGVHWERDFDRERDGAHLG